MLWKKSNYIMIVPMCLMLSHYTKHTHARIHTHSKIARYIHVNTLGRKQNMSGSYLLGVEMTWNFSFLCIHLKYVIIVLRNTPEGHVTRKMK